MNNGFSFDDIPHVLGDIVNKLEELGKKIDQFQQNKNVEADRWFDIFEVCDYIPSHPTTKTVYRWTSSRTIPFHKTGKNISFRQSEIDQWLARGKRKSHDEIAMEAEEYVRSKRKGGVL